MFKKLTGIFILLSFLLVKNTPLFAMDGFKQNIVVGSAEQQGAEEMPDAEKESNQLETIDEDFIQESIKVPGFLMRSNQAICFNTPRINTPYISLPYPPPNDRF